MLAPVQLGCLASRKQCTTFDRCSCGQQTHSTPSCIEGSFPHRPWASQRPHLDPTLSQVPILTPKSSPLAKAQRVRHPCSKTRRCSLEPPILPISTPPSDGAHQEMDVPRSQRTPLSPQRAFPFLASRPARDSTLLLPPFFTIRLHSFLLACISHHSFLSLFWPA